jgi:AhpC/TSA family
MLYRFIVTIAVIFAGAVPASAQDFNFTTPAGQTVSLSSLRGKVVVLMFSGIQDPQCRQGLEALDKMAVERYQGKGVQFYLVSVNSASELPNDQLKSTCGGTNSISVLRDTNQVAFKRFCGKSGQLPTIVIFDRQGNAVGRPRGGFNPNSDFINDLASTIDGVLQTK